jgi:hypothetical protein
MSKTQPEKNGLPTMRNETHFKAQDYGTEPPVDQNLADFANRKLTFFAQNCRLFAERVAVGQLRLIDAADMLQTAAELSGFCEMVGDDVVQRTMADAFTAFAGRNFS